MAHGAPPTIWHKYVHYHHHWFLPPPGATSSADHAPLPDVRAQPSAHSGEIGRTKRYLPTLPGADPLCRAKRSTNSLCMRKLPTEGILASQRRGRHRPRRLTPMKCWGSLFKLQNTEPPKDYDVKEDDLLAGLVENIINFALKTSSVIEYGDGDTSSRGSELSLSAYNDYDPQAVSTFAKNHEPEAKIALWGERKEELAHFPHISMERTAKSDWLKPMVRKLQKLKLNDKNGVALKEPSDFGGIAGVVRVKLTSMSAKMKEKMGKKAQLKKDQQKDALFAGLLHLPPVEAIRQALVLRCGDLASSMRYMDIKRSGRINKLEFKRGLQGLSIDWKAITTLSIGELFKLFDVSTDGQVTMEDLLGIFIPPKDDVNHADTMTLWWKYWNKSNMSRSALARNPCWESYRRMDDEISTRSDQEQELRTRSTYFAKQLRQSNDKKEVIAHLKRALLCDPGVHPSVLQHALGTQREKLRQSRTRIAHVLRDLCRCRRDMADISRQVNTMFRLNEMKRLKALGMNPGGPEALDFGGLVQQSTMDARCIDEYRESFERDFEVNLSEEEILFRNLAKRHHFPYSALEFEKAKKLFRAVDYDNNGFVNKKEFANFIRRLLPKMNIGQLYVDESFAMIDQDRSGCIEFQEFLMWYVSSGWKKA
eukprot:GEMP01019442.1.p1 GENE.GEMP01019442.1~~GEMP01019442.1.p1  ORF type:complete len:651 (+),score=129.79 GEMP01019442.1:20-1972(+)